MIKQHRMVSSVDNKTWPNSSHNVISKHLSSFTIIERAIFILSIIILFWIIFTIIYLSSRLILHFLSNLKRSKSDVNPKICQAFVISSNQYGSFRPIQTIYRSDSLLSNSNFAISNEKFNRITTYEPVHLTINHHSNLLDNFQEYQQTKTFLLEHYLKTYNPLQIDLTNVNDDTLSTSNVKVISSEHIPSETDTHILDNCYSLNCTNKHQTNRYIRLEEQESSSVNKSIMDEKLSENSTKLTSATLPVVMITDCSNSQRLHTDIIEMNEEEEEEE